MHLTEGRFCRGVVEGKIPKESEGERERRGRGGERERAVGRERKRSWFGGEWAKGDVIMEIWR